MLKLIKLENIEIPSMVDEFRRNYSRMYYNLIQEVQTKYIIAHDIQPDTEEQHFSLHDFQDLYYDDKLIGRLNETQENSPEIGIRLTITFYPYGWEIK